MAFVAQMTFPLKKRNRKATLKSYLPFIIEPSVIRMRKWRMLITWRHYLIIMTVSFNFLYSLLRFEPCKKEKKQLEPLNYKWNGWWNNLWIIFFIISDFFVVSDNGTRARNSKAPPPTRNEKKEELSCSKINVMMD